MKVKVKVLGSNLTGVTKETVCRDLLITLLKLVSLQFTRNRVGDDNFGMFYAAFVKDIIVVDSGSHFTRLPVIKILLLGILYDLPIFVDSSSAGCHRIFSGSPQVFGFRRVFTLYTISFF